MTKINRNEQRMEVNIKKLLKQNDDFRYILKIFATTELSLKGYGHQMNHIIIPIGFIQEIYDANVLNVILNLHDNLKFITGVKQL